MTKTLFEMEVQLAVEKALPSYMFVVLHEGLKKGGWVVKQDLEIYAQRSLQASVHDKDAVFQSVVWSKANPESDAILRAANADQPYQTWVALAHAILKAKSQGVYFDNNVLLLCTGIETELVDAADEYGGMPLIEMLADRMDNEARRRGWWKRSAGRVMH